SLLPVEFRTVRVHSLRLSLKADCLSSFSLVTHSLWTSAVGPPMPLCFIAASTRARCSGGILARVSGGMAGIPVMECVTVISQRPCLMLRGVILSAAQKVNEEKRIRHRRSLVRIRTLPASFDRRALNRITHCWLRGKSIVWQIVCLVNRLQDRCRVNQCRARCDAHRHLEAILSSGSAGSKCCTNRGDCYTNS